MRRQHVDVRDGDVRGPVPRESLKRSSSSRSFLGFFCFATLTADFSAFAGLAFFAVAEARPAEGSKTVSGTCRLGGLLGAASSASAWSRFRFLADVSVSPCLTLSLDFFFFFFFSG